MASGAQAHARERPIQFGKYTLLSRIATGGMGELYLAQLRAAGGFEKLVVIKRILPHLTDQPEFVDMFVEEARTAARITHPNVCQIYELGQVDGRFYMALEYLEGIPLSDVMVARKRARQLADLRLVVSLVTQAAEGLHHAHSLRGPDGESANLVHRDVNPRNIFVTSAGVAKVLDFGIVKVRGAMNRTRTGSVKGTYSYMSPEHLQGEPLDCGADIFSLGTITWEAVVGRRLFKRASDLLTWRAIVDEPVPRPSQFRYDLPPELDDAIMIALAKRREDRYRSSREFALALERAVKPQGAPMTTLAISGEIERAFATELGFQRERVFSAHKRQEADRLSAPQLAPERIDDWGGDGDGMTRVADPEYASLVATTQTSQPVRGRAAVPLRAPSEPPLNTPSEIHTLDQVVGDAAAASPEPAPPLTTAPPHAVTLRSPAATGAPAASTGAAPLSSLPPNAMRPPSFLDEPYGDTPLPRWGSESGVVATGPAMRARRGGRADIRPRSRLPMVLALVVVGCGAAALGYVLKNKKSAGAQVAAKTGAGSSDGADDTPGAATGDGARSAATGDDTGAAKASGSAAAAHDDDNSAGDDSGSSAGGSDVLDEATAGKGKGGGEDSGDRAAGASNEHKGKDRDENKDDTTNQRSSGGDGHHATAKAHQSSSSHDQDHSHGRSHGHSHAHAARPSHHAHAASHDTAGKEQSGDSDNHKQVAAKGDGFLTLNANPYATVYVDGKKRGYTPVVHLALPPGSHTIRLVSSAGQPDKRLHVRVGAGQEVRRFVKW